MFHRSQVSEKLLSLVTPPIAYTNPLRKIRECPLLGKFKFGIFLNEFVSKL